MVAEAFYSTEAELLGFPWIVVLGSQFEKVRFLQSLARSALSGPFLSFLSLNQPFLSLDSTVSKLEFNREFNCL